MLFHQRFGKKTYFYGLMPRPEHTWFNTLKKELAGTFRKAYPACTAPIEEWKGQDIVNFQEELMLKVKGRISEKWFYTHIKAQQEKLPRIDMLNMLSQYAGYADWRDFTSRQPDFTRITAEAPADADDAPSSLPLPPAENAATAAGKPRRRWLIVLAVCMVPVLLYPLLKKHYKTYRGCIVAQNGELLRKARPEVHWLKAQESPVTVACDSNGCFTIRTTEEQLRFSVSSPYYWPDTVTRTLEEPYTEEQVRLRSNDYALMIHYFSASDMTDWKARKAQLEEMISPAAKIFQVYTDGSGMELYNKEEFIHKMTMPLKSLKNIEIVETRYTGGQIALLRFMQTEQEQ